MKIRNWIFGIAVVMATVSLWAAEGPSENLQKGLFEEEANHNLEAAIKAYQAVIQQTDEQRKLGATAIFRLGECYRKLGRTNDAVAQYRRVFREFPEQEKLVQSSQQLERELIGGPAVGPYKNVSEFNTSAESAELQRIKGLVKDSPDLVNSPGPNTGTGGTLLHNAAGAGWMSVAEFLLANHAEVNATDRTKRTPLHSAAAAGHKSMIELLLAHGADVNAADSSGRTPLHEAALHGYKTVVEALLAGKANVNALGNYGWAPLHSAARNGHRAVAAVLIKGKADLNAHITGAVYESGMNHMVGATPLMVAAVSDFASFVDLLCEAGAQVDATDEQRDTALHQAVRSDAVKSVAVLLRYHANPNAENAYHYTPLHNAVIKKNKESVEAILAAGAKPNSLADDGSSPLRSAVELSRVDLAEAVLKAGADYNSTNRSGRTALHIAVENVNEPMTELLLNYKADPNSQDQAGWTPLHLLTWKFRNNPPSNDVGSFYRRCLAISKLLLSHKADVNLRNNEGLAPLNYFGVPAKLSKVADEEMIALLKEHGAIDDLPELAARPNVIRVWRKGLPTGRDVFSKDTAGRNRFTLLEALWSFYSSPSQYGGKSSFRPANQSQDANFDFPDLAHIKIRRLVEGKTYRPIEINLVKGPDDLPEIDCGKNVELEFGDVIEIPEREHALGEPPTGLEAQFRAQMQGCTSPQVKLITKSAILNLALDPGYNRYLSSALNKSEALKVIVSSADFSKIKVTHHNASGGKSEPLIMNVLEIRRGAKRTSEDLLLRDGDEVEVPEK